MNEGLAAPICAKIRELRKARGWSQDQLAKLTGMHRPIVVRLEKGHHCPSIPILKRLAEVFEVPVMSLVAPLDGVTIAEDPTTRAALSKLLEQHEHLCLDDKPEREVLLHLLMETLDRLQRKAWLRG